MAQEILLYQNKYADEWEKYICFKKLYIAEQQCHCRKLLGLNTGSY